MEGCGGVGRSGGGGGGGGGGDGEGRHEGGGGGGGVTNGGILPNNNIANAMQMRVIIPEVTDCAMVHTSTFVMSTT